MEGKKVLIKEADLLEALGLIIKRMRLVLVVTFCSAILGIVIALSVPKEYTAEVVLAPESSGSLVGASNVSSLASLVGVDFNASRGGEAIYPMLYPEIVSSLPFLTSLFDVNVKSLDETIDTTYYAYLLYSSEKTWLDVAKKIPSKTIHAVKRIFVEDSSSLSDDSKFNPYMLSKQQLEMVRGLESSINVFYDKKLNVITISFTDRDPCVAAIMADTIMNRLQNEVTKYRTKKADADCNYIERMSVEAKENLEYSQRQYAEFMNRNRNVINEHVIAEQERLEADKELNVTLYNQWAQQLQLAKAKVQESTPVFVTLKPVTIPVMASSLSRSIKVVLFTFIGFVFVIMYILGKEPFLSILRRFRGKSE